MTHLKTMKPLMLTKDPLTGASLESVCKVDEAGTRWWYLDEQIHRADGPAVEFKDGFNAWYKNGALHREDGAAVECTETGRKEYFLNGIELTEEEFNRRQHGED